MNSGAHPQITDHRQVATHIPFGISAVRESRVQPPINRSKQAG